MTEHQSYIANMAAVRLARGEGEMPAFRTETERVLAWQARWMRARRVWLRFWIAYAASLFAMAGAAYLGWYLRE